MKKDTAWHYLEWDEVKLARFYDWASQWSAWQDEYFSKQVGTGIVNFLRYVSPLKGRILDYGCGPGYLVDRLLGAGVQCEGVDFSPETVNLVNSKFANNPLWKGAKLFTGDKLSLPDDSFDLVICVETIEHVLPVHKGSLLHDLRRILKPETGRLFLTTPHAENLAKNQIYCPECSSVFHRNQHISSFSADSLKKLLADHGFVTLECNAVDFNRFQQPWVPPLIDWSPRRLAYASFLAWASFLDLIDIGKAPFGGGRRFQQLVGRGSSLFWMGKK